MSQSAPQRTGLHLSASSAARQLTDWVRPTLRVVQGRRSTARRAPFIVLVLLVLGAGLIGLLMLSTALQQGAFALDEMSTRTEELRDRQSALAEQVAERSAPGNLAEQARRAGMSVPEETLILDLSNPVGEGAGQ